MTMRSDDEIRRSLRAAYFDRENRAVGQGWRDETLRRVRRLGPLNGSRDPLALAERLVWRFAGAASALALASTVYYIGFGNGVGYELTRLFVDDPLGLGLLQSFGIL